MINVFIRFYAELNDFLPLEKRNICFNYTVSSRTSIKDFIESLGVPHTEIDLILVNKQSVNFNYQAQDNDYISVYPVFEAFDISDIVRLRPKPLRKTRFILDVHLGKLAKYLRLLGIDVLYKSYLSDKTIIELSQNEKRIILTRDVGLLKNKKVTHGYWIRHTEPNKQVEEVLKRFDLYHQCHPFTRCMECNGLLKKIKKSEISKELQPMTLSCYHHFMRCNQCNKVYWQGSHYQKLKNWVNSIKKLNHVKKNERIKSKK